MSIKNEIVVGIDVGTTSALCVLDKNLNVLFLKSKKEYKTSEMIDDILNFGKPLLICCDTKKIPKKILKIAKSFGVKVFHPKEDIKEEKKLKITYKYSYNNWHERDALFSAIIGAKFLRRKFFKKKEERVIKEEIKVREDKNVKKIISSFDDKNLIRNLVQKIKILKEENKKLKYLLEKIKQSKNIKYEIIEIKNEDLEIENKALKIVIEILKMKIEKDEIPYIKLEEINEKLLKIVKDYIENFVVVSNQVERFYVLEDLGIEFVITEKHVENIWNLKIIVDNIERYQNFGKINIELLKNKWKEKLQKIINEKIF